jgi:hypothetical protein
VAACPAYSRSATPEVSLCRQTFNLSCRHPVEVRPIRAFHRAKLVVWALHGSKWITSGSVVITRAFDKHRKPSGAAFTSEEVQFEPRPRCQTISKLMCELRMTGTPGGAGDAEQLLGSLNNIHQTQ